MKSLSAESILVRGDFSEPLSVTGEPKVDVGSFGESDRPRHHLEDRDRPMVQWCVSGRGWAVPP